MVCPSFLGGSSTQGVGLGGLCVLPFPDKGDGHRCEGRDVCSPGVLAAAPGRLPGMPAARLSLPGQGLHLPGEPGAPGSPGHPCQLHRAVSRERERWGAAAWRAKGQVCWESLGTLHASCPSSDTQLNFETRLHFSGHAHCKISLRKGFFTF